MSPVQEPPDGQNLGIFQFGGQQVTFSSNQSELDIPRQIRTLEGNVRITYGQDFITADKVEAHLDPNEEFLIARGAVHLVDPDGTIRADDLRISWHMANRYAYGDKVEIKIAGAVIRADTIELRPGTWTLTNYYFTLDRAKRPLYYVKGKQIVISPGHAAVLSDSQLYVLGQRILGYAEKVFNLDPRSSGIRLPTPEYRSGEGLGYDWNYSSPFERQYLVQAHDSLGRADLPAYGLTVVRNFVPVARDSFPIGQRSEFQMRFDFGYFDNLYVDLPSQEIAYLQRVRDSASVESNINTGVTGRGDSDAHTVPLSFQYEASGKVGSYANIADFKVEEIDEYRLAYHIRGEWLDSLELPARRLGPNLFSMGRVDTGVFQSNTNYLWVHSSESLVYKPGKILTLGASLFESVSNGTPQLDIDPLYYRNGLALRGDYKLGPRKLSVLFRYDTQLGFFDKEYSFTQVMGGLEGFVSYRDYPGDFHFGVMLRVDQFEDLITRRNWRKTPQVTAIGIP